MRSNSVLGKIKDTRVIDMMPRVLQGLLKKPRLKNSLLEILALWANNLCGSSGY